MSLGQVPGVQGAAWCAMAVVCNRRSMSKWHRACIKHFVPRPLRLMNRVIAKPWFGHGVDFVDFVLMLSP